MSRPSKVIFENFESYNLLHTRKSKMHSGVEVTVLLPIKETAKFHISVPVWSPYTSSFKKKKDSFDISVTIPTITNNEVIDFLEKHYWSDYIEKNQDDFTETVKYLKKLFPNKTPKYFYEFDSIVSEYCHGGFIKYNENGEELPLSEHDISSQKNLHKKFQEFNQEIETPDYVHALYKKYDDARLYDEKRTAAYKEYSDALKDFYHTQHNINHIFKALGENTVIYPVAFEKGTADWHKKEYGTTCPYAHAGEIIFVVTEDSVYFETKRHF